MGKMNPIGIPNEVRMSSGRPWYGGRRTTKLPGHGRAGPGGMEVRRSGWPGWRSATGRSCGPRAPAGSGWTRPAATPRSPPQAPCAAPAPSRAPSSAPPPGREPPPGLRLCAEGPAPSRCSAGEPAPAPAPVPAEPARPSPASWAARTAVMYPAPHAAPRQLRSVKACAPPPGDHANRLKPGCLTGVLGGPGGGGAVAELVFLA
jgi:hypothetical protein